MKPRKFTLLVLFASLFSVTAFANLNLLSINSMPAVSSSNSIVATSAVTTGWSLNYKDAPEVKKLSPEMLRMALKQFLELTPAKYKAMTGKNLGLKKTIELKMAQKYVKKKMSKSGDTPPKGLYIVLAILGWAWLLMGIMDDWSGNDWWINLLLTALCWLPGVIHAFVKMKKYY